LLDLLGEADGPLISNNEVKLRVLTQISTGENQLNFEGFYLDGRVPLGGGFDVSFRRAVWIFIISRSRQLAESSQFTFRYVYCLTRERWCPAGHEGLSVERFITQATDPRDDLAV
jgi:hypothetical protein